MRASKSSEQILTAKDELESMRRTSQMNRYFVPISKLPPISPDPRPAFGTKPPRCCPGTPGTSRTGRIMERWSSMPSLGSQMPKEHTLALKSYWEDEWAEAENLEAPSTGTTTTSLRPPTSPSRKAGSRQSSQQSRSREHSRNPDSKDFPHIPLVGCWQERGSPIPRLVKVPLGELAASLLAAVEREKLEGPEFVGASGLTDVPTDTSNWLPERPGDTGRWLPEEAIGEDDLKGHNVDAESP
mmetsp:Transcript_22008/g.39442  ORF Transcript_22008/g.39442 Transcript_22008/m.39442 type:complete len:242 (-) Transcript_22008:29-754(-)|eukprot:CAMPEP_0197654520 /NCGR_PEP_ID=MMETSP1338-20131121/38896_1 /TAXON_ID=43686 ORGANISM="Pelagodinium beii, Strain RCC1491" /NCGR_SAMPLE_ID=MMETSP1338 /ASSEMBLY_ACC=CAM_ASM_000754 /LENGTH=241 /DNA_ID=CAMNT_0043229973 /DNA_START=88 /DNA_END=813 /DNA_ORIENTATION=-